MESLRRLVVPAALLLAACTSTEPRAMHRISLSTTTASRGAAGSIALDRIVTGTGGSVHITSAQVVLARIKLASDAACTPTTTDVTNETDDPNEGPDAEGEEPNEDNNDESDCDEVHAGPVLVDLPLDGSTKVILDAFVPAGTYTGVRAKLDAVEGDENGASDFLTAQPEFAGLSVKVVGVFTDAGGTDHPFTFTSGVEAEIAVDFATPVTVDANSTNLTFEIDVASWFKAASGAIVDPTNAENQSAIEKAIRASVSAFEDDDHDGAEDHHEEGGP